MLLAFLSPKFLFSVFSQRNGGKALVSMFCQLSVFTSLEVQWCPRVISFSNHSLQIANLGKGLSGIVVNLCHSKMLLMQFYGCILYKEAFVKYSFTSVFIHFSLGRWWDLDVFKCCPLIKTSFSFFCYHIFSPSTHESWFSPGKIQPRWIWVSDSSFRYNDQL